MHDDDHPTAATCPPTGTRLPTAPTGFPTINDRYRVVADVGRGSMSTVYRVHDAILARDCALKLFAPGKGRPTIEARLAASLAHPAIVPVHDFGALEDGRRWMVMQLVEGTDLGSILATRRLGRRRLLDHLLRVARAIAYAHARDIVHRDLKPDNIRIDAHDAVFILDWGIAERIGEPGVRLGNPQYMAPEQGTDAISQPTMDVFSLGRLLARVLDAHRPDDREAESLRLLVTQCTAADPAARLADAQAFADALRAWFDGIDRRREADALVARADTALQQADSDRKTARALRAKAEATLAEFESYTPAAHKFAGWADEDAARTADTRARRCEVEAEQLLQEALRRVNALPAAIERLSALAMARLQRAHHEGDLMRAVDARQHLQLLDTAIAHRIAQPHSIRLHTDPPGAAVYAAEYRTIDRRLVARNEHLLGQTPLQVRLAPGSHRLRLVHADRAPVTLPIHIDWASPVDSIAPEDVLPCVIALPEHLETWERYVASGWCRVGGDDEVGDSLPGRRIWVDGFIMEARPLTCGALVAGLNAMLEAGEVDLAAVVGRLPIEKGDGITQLVRGADGRFAYDVHGDFDVSDWPAVQLDWNAARGWAEWRRRQTGQPWRLPDEVEWEKAARGADARKLPWGNFFEPTWACVVGSRSGDPRRGPASEWPEDASVYDVLGMAGNARTWCRNAWTKHGECAGPRLTIGPPAQSARHRILKGGFYLAGPRHARSAARYASHPDTMWASAGVRLVRSFTG